MLWIHWHDLSMRCKRWEQNTQCKKLCYCYGNERTILRELLAERRNHLHWASLKVVMNKISTLVSLNCRNFVAWSKRCICNRMGTMNSIMVLKDHFGFKFIHNSRFPRETKEKVFVFKMLVNLPINDINLVNKMKFGATWRIHGSCLIMWSTSMSGLQWHVIYMTTYIAKHSQ